MAAANNRDNIFKLFQGDANAAALAQQQQAQQRLQPGGGRRQYQPGPSQVVGLPGNQPLQPSESPPLP
jgi:hypothetical protein